MGKNTLAVVRFKKFVRFTVMLTVISFTIVSLSGCYFFPKEEEVMSVDLIKPEKVTYNTITVKKGTIQTEMNEMATVEPVNSYSLSFKYRGGYIKNIYVQEGDPVFKGTLLAELDTESLKSQITDKNFDIENAQQSYNNAKTSAVSQIKLAKMDLKESQDNYKRATTGESVYSDSDLESLKNRIRRDEIALSQITNSTRMTIDTAQRNLEKVKLELKDLQTELAKSRITAPVAGDIQSIGDINIGDYVEANKTIVTMSDSSKVHIRYSGEKAGSFKLGMALTVTLNEKNYMGKVVATPKQAPISQYESLKDSVFIELINPPSIMSVGDSVDLHVILFKKDNVIVLPSNIIKEFQGRMFVKLLENGIPVERTVEVGIESTTESEVTKGLKVGEKVIED